MPQMEPRDVDDVDGRMSPFSRAAGVTSWEAFVTGGARLVAISFDERSVFMKPTQRRGLGFTGRTPADITVAEHPSDERLGAMLRECFARCA